MADMQEETHQSASEGQISEQEGFQHAISISHKKILRQRTREKEAPKIQI